MTDQYAVEWDYFVVGLRMVGILLTGVPDVMIWASDKKFGLVTASIVYESLLLNQLHIDPLWWFSKI